MNKIRIEYDDTASNIIVIINNILKDRGLKFVSDNLEHDGYEIYTLEVTKGGPWGDH